MVAVEVPRAGIFSGTGIIVRAPAKINLEGRCITSIHILILSTIEIALTLAGIAYTIASWRVEIPLGLIRGCGAIVANITIIIII
jgi:hypothetical protein